MRAGRRERYLCDLEAMEDVLRITVGEEEKVDTARRTDERLRSALNSDQPSRERLCVAVLELDRNYSAIQPRRPEGGRDGGRDIECTRNGVLCFGAVGFLNNVSDSPQQKSRIKKKFAEDVDSALRADEDLKAFVFFTNVDITPGEIKELKQSAETKGLSFVDIYWRERIRQVLDGVEGMAIRYQYLGIELSPEEQASFFSRFGRDLQDLVAGRFDLVEHTLRRLEFALWQASKVRRVTLDVTLKEPLGPSMTQPAHFRVCLELQGLAHEKRSIILGGDDDSSKSPDGDWYLGTRSFFYREGIGGIHESWLPPGPQVRTRQLSVLRFGAMWRPFSDMPATVFEDLHLHFHCSENLLQGIARVKFAVDSYVFFDGALRSGIVEYAKPSLGWPSRLTDEQENVKWRFSDLGSIRFDRVPDTE